MRARRAARPLLFILTVGLMACGPITSALTPTATQVPFTPTATSTPTATPTPTPSPADHLSAGNLALRNGDWDLALQEFQAAGAASDPGPQGEGQFGIGETYVRAGLFAQGNEALTTFLSLHSDHERAADAYFLRATARRALGDVEGAISDYDAYLAARPGRIDSYVQEWAGDLLSGSARNLEAARRYQAAASLPRLGSAAFLHVKAARAFLDGDDPASALSSADLAHQTAGEDFTRASANLYAGRALVALDDPQAGYARWLDSVEKYAGALDTYEALVELVDAGVPVDEFRRGYIDYLAGAYQPAVQAFGRVIEREPSGEAYYYRALSRRELGDYTGALEDFYIVYAAYTDFAERDTAWIEAGRTASVYAGDYAQGRRIWLQLVDALPASEQAPQALLSAGKASEVLDELNAAVEQWMRVPNEYPQSPLASQAAFLAGITRVRLGDVSGASEAFAAAGERAQTPEDRAAAAMWVGKTLEAQGRHEEAVTAWQTAAASDPTGYYSARAEDLIAGRGIFEPFGVFQFPDSLEAERVEAEAWLRVTFAVPEGPPLNRLWEPLASDPRLLRGEELLRLGMYPEAKAELTALREASATDAAASFGLMHRFLDLGLYELAIRTSRQILDLAGMDDAGTMSAPIYFNRIRFGPYFGDLILPQAMANGFDGLFLLSVVRQESLFEGFATSYADARGLMQVIPSTGAAIAVELGWPPGYTEADLHRPLVSVRFGTHYLASERDRFGGDLYAALAAYNAGPGNSLAWKELAPNDPDLFLEVIRFSEPRLYIKTIFEVFSIYRQLYSSP
ncbi:MAG TPA: transglycosylase SLT domain-containing protein [Anaerolineales bacterium]|nr:transglycosylase SLT domain-containing protein [Anaerolineales bacterium]